MKLLTFIILAMTLLSCGKTVKNYSGNVQDFRSQYRSCSTESHRVYCSNTVSNYRMLRPHFFSNGCYRAYLNCLNAQGVTNE